MDYLVKYGFNCTAGKVASSLAAISSALPERASEETLKTCFASMDLTTLHTGDTVYREIRGGPCGKGQQGD